MFPNSSCSGSKVAVVRGALRKSTTPTEKQTAKRMAIDTSDLKPTLRRSAPIPMAASAVNGIATTSGDATPRNMPRAMPPKAACERPSPR